MNEPTYVRAVGRRNCSGCRRWRPVYDFPRDAAAITGIRSRCKACHREDIRARKRAMGLGCELPAKPLRDAVNAARSRYLAREIVELSGVSQRALTALTSGRSATVLESTADRLTTALNMRLEELWPGVYD